jgi:hypothetical protein
MPLNPPQVGRLSVCSTTVVMQHQLPGAELTLHTATDSFPLGTAGSVWEVMDLPPDLSLVRDDRLVATQSLNGETSPPSTHSIVHGTGPSPGLPHPHPDSHIYACAGYVGLGGMTPGATAEVRRGGTLLGTGLAHEGAAIVKLSNSVPSSPGLQARAITCGHSPVTVTLPPGDTAPIDQTDRLPAPIFASPMMECVEWLRIDGIVPGATVFLTRGDGSGQKWGFVTRSWLVRLARPLEEGERVALRQEFDLCKIGGHEIERDVGPLVVGKPKLASPWCAGRVVATDLIPGATVVFFKADGTEIGRSGASGTACQFTVQQPNSVTLFARQELCGVLSDKSNSVDAGTDPDIDLTPPNPVIIEPVFACHTRVRVKGQVKGGVVEIWSHSRGMIGWRHSMGPETSVEVPALLGGEKIEAHAVTCSMQSDSSPVVTAQPVGDLQSPEIATPLHEGATTVSVRPVKVGAQVDVYVDGRFVNGRVAEADPLELPVPRLVSGQQVQARQHLCGKVRAGESATVVSAPPPTPKPKEGFSQLVVFNCHTEHRTVTVWLLDHTAGTTTRVGALEPNYDDWGSCPAQGEPLEVEFPDGHVCEIVVVDPGALNCNGQDDPMVGACRRLSGLVFLGSSGGPAFPCTVA